MHSAADLLGLTSSDATRQQVGQAMGVSQLVVTRWRNIALLSAITNGPNPGQLDVLIANNIDSPEALRTADIPELMKDVTAAIQYSLVEITEDDLKAWAHPHAGAIRALDPAQAPAVVASFDEAGRGQLA